MSGSSADLDAAIARLNTALGGLEARVRDLKARADAKPAAAGDDDLFAAAREASQALDQAAAEIRAVLEEA